ncbi:putative tubulin polyglutamylase ttll2 [Clydaea vesicula]|uniref:Tubulin polyglutamylase ttll2 n=1 Tax=Clydaea vesicula TaxID=447962 RepID=A0AAD5U334_9FUNG|nr:putative tubulin polyglutamylase ttll2 [Clydaea vesicula]
MSRGRGIFLVKDLKDCIYDTNAIIQVYIERPFYVVVRSFNPLVVYIYNEGMARFATNKYNTTDIKDVFSHLTNTSINKFSPTLQNEKEEIGPGCKWTLNTLNSFLKLKGINFDEIFKKIKAIILYTIIPITNDVILHSYSCFELFGFDIIIDQNLKPCLLEVNLSPALSVDSSIDIEVKKPLLSDIISMMNYTESDGDLAFVAEENLHVKNSSSISLTQIFFKLNKRKNSASSTKTKEQNAKERNSFNFASEVGKFEMIYPFNELTKKHSNLKVGQPVTREILQQIRKKYS